MPWLDHHLMPGLVTIVVVVQVCQVKPLYQVLANTLFVPPALRSVKVRQDLARRARRRGQLRGQIDGRALLRQYYAATTCAWMQKKCPEESLTDGKIPECPFIICPLWAKIGVNVQFK